MKKLFYASLMLISNCIYSQNNFEIDLRSDSYINDSLMLGAPSTRKGFGDLYTFKIQTNNNISDFGKKIRMAHSIYYFKIQKKNIVNGFIEYPQPVAFGYMGKKGEAANSTKVFFLEKGKYKIDLPKDINNVELNIDSPTNKEYKALQTSLEPFYIKSKSHYQLDSLINMDKKQEFLGEYIRKNPNSYVALWEIVNDYTLNDYHPAYLENLNLFSAKFKQNKLYKGVEARLKAEQSTSIGQKIPDIYFDKQNKLTSEDFKKYKLTFIDYWSTTCAPCIKGMPEIVKLYNEYKDQNVNFITITDEQKPNRMEVAKNILKKNNANWINFFDVNKDFQKKVNATNYPIHFIIDENGKIIARISNGIEEARTIIKEYLR
ncbi:TlpA family protein disulfide reductase [Chryseobacterium sp. S0630]|uniref:TlpA family protein disulfide reductase n=1 Tax=Chryseobacterium sp. S0630 TaxID=2957803 RepID=UPI000557623B|nr:TlpA disulfide reductase family protein [Chryseobacterium sp. S0630]MCP1301462.1 TlpA family protein disulfide reductase [Chryseobacterium sp. S0630]